LARILRSLARPNSTEISAGLDYDPTICRGRRPPALRDVDDRYPRPRSAADGGAELVAKVEREGGGLEAGAFQGVGELSQAARDELGGALGGDR